MAQNTVIEPPESLRRVADLIDEGVRQVVQDAPKRATITLGRYEAPIEGKVLVTLQARHLEALCELARRDVVLLPPAMVIARSIFETAARTLWLLHPTDAFEGEARWLAHLQTEESWLNKAGKLLETLGEDPIEFYSQAEQFRAFREKVAAKLPPGVVPPNQVPDLRTVLRGLGDERKYLYYLKLSQFAHGAFNAGGLYRRHLGTQKTLGEDIKPGDWKLVFSAAWPAFVASSGVLYVKFLGADPPLSDDFQEQVITAIEAIT